MIDYIGEKQHHFDSEIENYEHNLDYLRGQLDFQTNKNITIEVTPETPREMSKCLENNSSQPKISWKKSQRTTETASNSHPFNGTRKKGKGGLRT